MHTFHKIRKKLSKNSNLNKKYKWFHSYISVIHLKIIFQDGDDPWPVNAKGDILESDTDYLETWRGMEECVNQGLTRSIGISNFNSEQISRLLESAKIAPVNNQVNS